MTCLMITAFVVENKIYNIDHCSTWQMQNIVICNCVNLIYVWHFDLMIKKKKKRAFIDGDEK